MTMYTGPSLTRRTKLLLAILTFLVIVAIGWGPKIRREVLVRLVLRSDAPAQSVVEEIAQSDADPIGFLSRLWQSGNVARRQLAMAALQQRSAHRDPTDKRI